jgi:predicted Zn-dependent peptidase
MTILFEKRSNPVVSVAIAVRCGGMHESVSEKGISHFIEHMIYQGTPARNAKQIAQEIESKGGHLNGFTSRSVTAFFCKMPSKHLLVALEVLSDIVKNPLFDEKEIEKARKVIFEEIKLDQDNPLHYIFQGAQSSLYKKPFGIPLIGTNETLSSLTRENLVKRFQKVYQPNNMVLCVVGNADFNQIIDFAKKNFGKKKGRIPRFKIVKKNESRVEKRKGINQANLVFGYHIPTSRDKKNYAAFVLNVLMAGGMSSRLFQEIRQKRNLAYAVEGESEITRDFAYNLIYVGTTPDKVNKSKKLFLMSLNKFQSFLMKKNFLKLKSR